MAGEQAPNSVAIEYSIDTGTTPEFDVPKHLYVAIPLESLKEQGEPRKSVTVSFLDRLVHRNFTDDMTHMRPQWDIAIADLQREGAEVKVVGPDHDQYYLEVPSQRPTSE